MPRPSATEIAAPLTGERHNVIVVFVIPAFDADGNLPAGIHNATWDEFQAAFSGSPHRRQLVAGLYLAATALKAAGCSRIYLNGSFVTQEGNPGDFDACWEQAGVDPTLLDPIFFDFKNFRLAQKLRFGGEFFPATWNAQAPPSFRTFLDFFQHDKNTGKRKGIVAIDLGSLP